MRNIQLVIDDVLKVLPQSEECFRRALSHFQAKARWIPPEELQTKWTEFTFIFNAYVPYPVKIDWQQKAVDIFTDDHLQTPRSPNNPKPDQ